MFVATLPSSPKRNVSCNIFEAYDYVINGIKVRFCQLDFEIYKHIQNIFINAVNQICYEDSLSILKEMYERDFY